MMSLQHAANPYVGPRPFQREDAERFFGRDKEAQELASRLVVNPVMVLYAQSGAGKTSLINARLIPLLHQKGCEVLPVARVRGQAGRISGETIRNVYVFHTVLSLASESADVQRLAKLSLKDSLQQISRATDEEGFHALSILIVDQLEEVFTLYPERWQDRKDFFDQIGQALEADPQLRVLLALREDYLGELEPYGEFLPGKLRTQFRLERLRSKAALEAVELPLQTQGSGWTFEQGVAENLVDNLLRIPIEVPTGRMMIRQEFVDPVQLQVVCQSVWAHCQSSRPEPSDKKVITSEDLEAFGDIDKALSSFYESAINRAIQATGVKEGVLRRWFEQDLITATGTRGIVFQGPNETGGIPNAVVEQLVNQHIIRAEMRGGGRWYELTHDRLIAPIKASNEHWILSHSGDKQTQRRLEVRAEQWVRNGRSEEDLLDGGELLEARRWLESPSAADIGYTEALFSLVQASEVRRREQEWRIRRRLAAFVAILALLLLSLTIIVWAQRQRIKRLEKQIDQHNTKAASD
jgi:hypothetical protein